MKKTTLRVAILAMAAAMAACSTSPRDDQTASSQRGIHKDSPGGSAIHDPGQWRNMIEHVFSRWHGESSSDAASASTGTGGAGGASGTSGIGGANDASSSASGGIAGGPCLLTTTTATTTTASSTSASTGAGGS